MEGQGQAGPTGGPLQDIQSYLTDFNKEIADNGSQQQFQAAEAPAEQSDLYDVALTEPTSDGNQINGEQEIQEEQTQETVTVSQIQETQIVVPESQEATQDMSQVTTVPETQEIPQGKDETQSDVQISVEGTLVEQHIVTSETGQVLAQVASESHGTAVVLGDLGVQQLAVQSAAGQTQQQVQVEQAMSQPEIVHLQQPEQQVLDAGLAGQVHLVNANQTIPQTIVIQQPVVENIVQHHTLEGQDIAQVAAAVSQTMPALQGAQVVTDQQMQMQMQQTEQGTIYIQQEVPGQQATEYVTQAALGQQGITVVSLPQGMSVSQSNAAILDAVAQQTVGVPVQHEHTQLVTVSQVAHHHVPEQQQELADTETPETQQVTVSVTETTLPQPVVKDQQAALKTTTAQQKDSVQASLEPIQIKPQDSEKAERETTKAEVLAQISVQNTEEEQDEEDAVKQKQEKTTQEEEQQAEEGTDEQQAEEEGEEAAEEEAPQEGQGDGQNFQTVTLVPSDVNQGGEVSYVLIVSQGEDGDKGDGKMDMSVYDFKEEGRIITTEEQTTTDAQGRKIIKVTPKKNPQTSSGQLMCNYCNYTSTKRYLLTRHMKTHSEERPHKCNICDRAFKTIVSLTNHINTHTGTRPHRCKECDAAFTTSGELVRHVRYRHTFEKPHKCPECDYSSVELSKLKRHIRSHTGERPYQCPHCSYASPDTYKLKRHLRVHTGEKPYECEFCHARFTQSNSLKAHKLIHSGSKPVYQCELCPTTCGRKTDLKIHIQKLHTSDKPLMCKKCGKSFPDRYTYKLHVKTHEGEKCFRCELCPYAALSQRHLESHILTHTGEKPFQCNECDQSFRQKQLLKRHKNLYHTPDYVPPAPKDKAYECTECQKTFAHKGNLLRHLMHHDPDLQLSKEMLDSSLQEVIITDNTDQNTILVSQAEETPRTISTTTVRRRAKTAPATTALEIPVQTVQLVQVVDESGQNTTQILLQMEDGSTPVVAGTTSRAAFREVQIEEGEEEVMEKQEMEEEEEDEPIIPKKEEPLAETATPKKRGRGRPPKRQIQVEEAQEEDEADKLQEKKEDEGEEEEEEGTAGAGRRSPRTRGIVKTQATATTPTKTTTAKSPARRGRGRPPAAAAAPPPEPEEEEEVEEEEVMQESPATPKSRGRKRKAVSPEDEEAEVEEEGDDEEMESPMKKLRRQQRKTPQKGKRSVQVDSNPTIADTNGPDSLPAAVRAFIDDFIQSLAGTR